MELGLKESQRQRKNSLSKVIEGAVAGPGLSPSLRAAMTEAEHHTGRPDSTAQGQVCSENLNSYVPCLGQMRHFSAKKDV